jgi:hypothetical protein
MEVVRLPISGFELGNGHFHVCLAFFETWQRTTLAVLMRLPCYELLKLSCQALLNQVRSNAPPGPTTASTPLPLPTSQPVKPTAMALTVAQRACQAKKTGARAVSVWLSVWLTVFEQLQWVDLQCASSRQQLEVCEVRTPVHLSNTSLCSLAPDGQESRSSLDHVYPHDAPGLQRPTVSMYIG